MTTSSTATRGGSRTVGARRAGYVVAALVNGLLLLLTNTWPGWEAVSVLTSDTPRVLGLVNASLIAGLAANLVYLVRDPPWLRALGDLVTTSIGLAALVRIWQVFPIEVDGGWRLVARLLLALGVFGSVVGIISALVRWTRCVRGRTGAAAS
jgi:hypothetical protein